ncbi:MAG: GNAT family N-acetyltransferase, partial [Verrucomicrobiaceae bacterium]
MKTLVTAVCPALETERLQFRAPHRGDIAAVVRHAGDPRVALKTTRMPHPYRVSDAVEWMEELQQSDETAFAIELKSQPGQMIGLIALKPREDRVSAEVGYWLGVPYWRRGYMTEALRGVLRHAFEERGFLYVTANHMAGNPASGRVMQKAGMKFESIVAGGLSREGVPHDKVNYGLFADEWKALQAHPIIAQRFLGLVPDLPKEIGSAIGNHHERIDGTGYPYHIFGDKLPMVSQIIAATDNIIFNHSRYQDYGVHAHTMLLTALKLSDNIYFESVYDAAMVLFKHAPSPSTNLVEAPSVDELIVRQKMLQRQFNNAKFLSQKLMAFPNGPMIRSVSAVMGRLAISVVRSGILQPEQEEWLSKFSR